MFGMWNEPDEERRAGARSGRASFGGGGFRWGGGGERGGSGSDFLRFGRMLAQGDLRVLALWLISEQPRHGYEIIKILEEKTGGWYSPSPGVVYPTLTYLEEAGYARAEVQGSRKLYTITDEGRAYLAENRDFVEGVLGRLSAAADRVAQWRREFGFQSGSAPGAGPGAQSSRLIAAALDQLREVADEVLRVDREAEARVLEILARAAADLRRR